MCATENTPTPTSAGIPVSTPRSPSPLAIEPVSIPPGCHPIELVQFWRGESKHAHPLPLHWALFVRTTPPTKPHRKPKLKGRPRPTPAATGNVYELVGDPETYTAQILHGVVFTPDRVPDWRGTHVVGWVLPTALPMFERAVTRVQVWRHRADWRSQHWVYEVLCTCGDRPEGVFLDVGASFGGLQKRMAKLLDAWEKGDI